MKFKYFIGFPIHLIIKGFLLLVDLFGWCVDYIEELEGHWNNCLKDEGVPHE